MLYSGDPQRPIIFIPVILHAIFLEALVLSFAAHRRREQFGILQYCCATTHNFCCGELYLKVILNVRLSLMDRTFRFNITIIVRPAALHALDSALQSYRETGTYLITLDSPRNYGINVRDSQAQACPFARNISSNDGMKTIENSSTFYSGISAAQKQ